MTGFHHGFGDGHQRWRALDQVALGQLGAEADERLLGRVRRQRRLLGQSGHRRVVVELVRVQR